MRNQEYRYTPIDEAYLDRYLSEDELIRYKKVKTQIADILESKQAVAFKNHFGYSIISRPTLPINPMGHEVTLAYIKSSSAYGIIKAIDAAKEKLTEAGRYSEIYVALESYDFLGYPVNAFLYPTYSMLIDNIEIKISEAYSSMDDVINKAIERFDKERKAMNKLKKELK
jgi:hypothetical protein